MKKVLLLGAMCAMAAFQGAAQISTAEPTVNTIRVGNRPTQGSFGIYVGMTADMFNDLFDKNTQFKSLPLVNVKYMFTDHWEGRLGMQFYKKGESAKFEFENQDGEYKAEYLTTTNRFYPGVAYHFSPNNILDIYGGAELLFGWNKEKDQVLYDDKYSGGAGSMTSTQFGGGLFIGLQAFIADLPVAVGIEYGFHGYGNHGLKYKQETEDGDVYQINPDMFKNINVEGGAKKMGASTSNFGQQVRFTISYYFNR